MTDSKRIPSPTLHPLPKGPLSDEARSAFLRCWVASSSDPDYVRTDFLTIDRGLSPILRGDPLAARVAFRRCEARMTDHPAYIASDWRIVEIALFDDRSPAMPTGA